MIKKDEKKEEPKAPEFASKETVDKLGADMSEIKNTLTIIMGKFSEKKIVHAVNDEIRQSGPLKLGEIGQGGIELATEHDLKMDSLELEKFMNEYVTVIVHEPISSEDWDVIPVFVNGICQPMMRGVEIVVKRKYLENLARCKPMEVTTRPTSMLDDSNMVNRRVSYAYPFTLIKDSEKGKTWMKKIRAEAH